MLRIGLGILWLVHFLPLRAIRAIGAALGSILYTFGRTATTDTNLALCFPDLSATERKRLARRHYRALGRSVMELGVLWWSSAQRIKGFVRLEGREYLAAYAGRPAIVLAPHFVGVDMGSLRLTMEFSGAAIYSQQKAPLLDRLMLRGRTRFSPTRMISRQAGLRPAIRALREGLPLYLLPDMDMGRKESLFVPFLGVTAATIPIVPRLAKLTGAAVVPVVAKQLPEGGYLITLYPAWENYPTDDLVADTRRINEFIEARVREMPEQYFWIHKRFRTRPPGENRKLYR
jgi:Kdo2-lipid IVA lauroyltransferase/acyltransferase